MGAVGIVVAWAGYSLFVWGYSKVKGAYGFAPSLTFSDIVLPSHRSTYLAAAQAWPQASTGNAGQGTTGSSQGPVIIAQAQAHADAVCAQYGAGSSNCTAAQRSLAQVKAIYAKAGQ